MFRHSTSVLGSLGLVLLLSCGGSVVVDDDGGAGAGGSSGGTSGTGGGLAGTGGGVAGTGGGVAGTGGGVAGTGGGVAGTGGSTCQELPDCNWCNGETVYEPDGCPVGYVCANGANPCTTGPCFGPGDCLPNQKCVDQLCWSAGPVSCVEGMCSGGAGGGAQTCACDWECDDGNAYAFDCMVSTSGSSSCTCRKNGAITSECGMGGMGGSGPIPDPCSVAECCGFPQ